MTQNVNTKWWFKVNTQNDDIHVDDTECWLTMMTQSDEKMMKQSDYTNWFHKEIKFNDTNSFQKC